MKTDTQPQGCTNFRLRRVTRLVSRHYDVQLARCGLKATQFSLLTIVQAQGPMRLVELAGAMDVEASTLTRNVKPLLDAGWLSLSEGADARSRLVAITEAGRVKLDEARACWRSAQQQLNAALGKPQVAALHALLDQTLAQLQHVALHEAAAQKQA